MNAGNLIFLTAVILSLLFVLVPGILWVTDRIFRKPLEQRLFVVKWNTLMVVTCIVCWGLWLYLRFLS